MKPYQAAIMNAFCLRNICEDIMDYADVEFLFSMQLGRGFASIHILRVGYIILLRLGFARIYSGSVLQTVYSNWPYMVEKHLICWF